MWWSSTPHLPTLTQHPRRHMRSYEVKQFPSSFFLTFPLIRVFFCIYLCFPTFFFVPPPFAYKHTHEHTKILLLKYRLNKRIRGKQFIAQFHFRCQVTDFTDFKYINYNQVNKQKMLDFNILDSNCFHLMGIWIPKSFRQIPTWLFFPIKNANDLA